MIANFFLICHCTDTLSTIFKSFFKPGPKHFYKQHHTTEFRVEFLIKGRKNWKAKSRSGKANILWTEWAMACKQFFFSVISQRIGKVETGLVRCVYFDVVAFVQICERYVTKLVVSDCVWFYKLCSLAAFIFCALNKLVHLLIWHFLQIPPLPLIMLFWWFALLQRRHMIFECSIYRWNFFQFFVDVYSMCNIAMQ